MVLGQKPVHPCPGLNPYTQSARSAQSYRVVHPPRGETLTPSVPRGGDAYAVGSTWRNPVRSVPRGETLSARFHVEKPCPLSPTESYTLHVEVMLTPSVPRGVDAFAVGSTWRNPVRSVRSCPLSPTESYTDDVSTLRRRFHVEKSYYSYPNRTPIPLSLSTLLCFFSRDWFFGMEFLLDGTAEDLDFNFLDGDANGLTFDLELDGMDAFLASLETIEPIESISDTHGCEILPGDRPTDDGWNYCTYVDTSRITGKISKLSNTEAIEKNRSLITKLLRDEYDSPYVRSWLYAAVCGKNEWVDRDTLLRRHGFTVDTITNHHLFRDPKRAQVSKSKSHTVDIRRRCTVRTNIDREYRINPFHVRIAKNVIDFDPCLRMMAEIAYDASVASEKLITCDAYRTKAASKKAKRKRLVVTDENDRNVVNV